MKAWYDVKTKAEQVNRTLFQKLQVRFLVIIINLLCEYLYINLYIPTEWLTRYFPTDILKAFIEIWLSNSICKLGKRCHQFQ